jgi:putative aminopeptidase FrvX
MNKKSLLSLLEQPTAPYREGLVIQWIKNELNRSQVPFFQDSTGNIIMGVASEQEYRILLGQNEKEPVRVFIAHMDHPGFHGVKWKNKQTLEVKWFGGSPRKHLVGSRVWISNPAGQVYDGILSSATLDKKKTHLSKGTVKIKENCSEHKAPTLFGGFGFRKAVWEKSGIVYTKAADDLVGCFVAIETAKKAAKLQSRKFIGILTRAEEVGFVGCIAHFELGWLKTAKRPLVIVSLETSRTLPGALVGKGPVVRLGDRAGVFSGPALEVLSQIAQKKLPKKFQKRVMDGGTCEATVAVVNQVPAVGISIPLGNYHNQGFEGGPDCRGPEGPAPEFVSLSDIKGMLVLCEELLKDDLPWEDPWSERRKQLLSYLEEGKDLLAFS